MPGLIGLAGATASLDKARLDIRQADIIRPAIGAQRYVMAAVAVEHSDFRKTKRTPVGNAFFAFLLTVFALCYTGRAVAEHEIYTSKTTYNFNVKDAPPVIGKILRASSSDFIVFADDRELYLPSGEIKQVKATDELKE